MSSFSALKFSVGGMFARAPCASGSKFAVLTEEAKSGKRLTNSLMQEIFPQNRHTIAVRFCNEWKCSECMNEDHINYLSQVGRHTPFLCGTQYERRLAHMS